ncbi:hypothetical protein DPEC_G00225400 [Dallia pectoralis]|uniref:Uncharacterized protein n=1 Tax=Dallia pectoralis TaxID=75939 RepID=A0ACC2G0B4_DALPE|nr:hypothetical protein DPEC_G00225400 [Dallia pectoralis]
MSTREHLQTVWTERVHQRQPEKNRLGGCIITTPTGPVPIVECSDASDLFQVKQDVAFCLLQYLYLRI